VVQGVAEHLPFPDATFDAALAVLTTHHWPDHRGGLAELVRVSGSQVILTWDAEVSARFWLVAEYLPEIAAHELQLPTCDDVVAALQVTDVRTVPVPADCRDGFFGAYWRRPEQYLDPDVRRSISAFAFCDPSSVTTAMARLQDDLASGRWASRHRDLLARETLDVGYRLVVARGLAPSAVGDGDGDAAGADGLPVPDG
jgi:SAM-dependent methyltransferase